MEKAAKKYKIREDGHAVFVEQVFVETQYCIYTQKWVHSGIKGSMIKVRKSLCAEAAQTNEPV